MAAPYGVFMSSVVETSLLIGSVSCWKSPPKFSLCYFVLGCMLIVVKYIVNLYIFLVLLEMCRNLHTLHW